MSIDVDHTRGAPAGFRNDRGGAVTRNYPVVGIVKNNIDPTKSGRIQVYLADFGIADSDDSRSWVTVSYMSPFYGITYGSGGSPNDNGNYVGTPNSYGMWATPPDIGTRVMCIFVNGDVNLGYYIGCIPVIGMNHMIPAVGASTDVVANSGEGASYGGATRLPVTEMNLANEKLYNTPEFTSTARPIHSYVAAVMAKQGLIRDTVRGPISSSASRESPSRVFGISTPGRPVYDGGYTDENISDKIDSASSSSLKVVARLGGHSIVMDDGDISGKDQLMRLRTSLGHQIIMNDAEDTLHIISANGKSWVELGKEGTVDIYSTNSVNIRTHGDINLHADNNINFHAQKSFNVSADKINIQSKNDLQLRSGADFSVQSLGKYTMKCSGAMAFSSGGMGSFASSGTTYINGSIINLNTGSASTQPAKVKELTINKHPDTVYEDSIGYVSVAEKLESITSRAPTHAPWENAGKGI